MKNECLGLEDFPVSSINLGFNHTGSCSCGAGSINPIDKGLSSSSVLLTLPETSDTVVFFHRNHTMLLGEYNLYSERFPQQQAISTGMNLPVSTGIPLSTGVNSPSSSLTTSYETPTSTTTTTEPQQTTGNNETSENSVSTLLASFYGMILLTLL